jgi:AcrR family transcriptional regulator
MKDRIIAASLEMFLKNGIQAVSIQTITRNTGVSSKTIYKLFRDKNQLLEKCLAVHYNRLFDQLNVEIASASNALEALLKLNEQVVDLEFRTNPVFYQDLNYYYPLLQDKTGKRYGKKIQEILIGVFNQGKTNGYFRNEIQPEVFFITLNAIYGSITRNRIFEPLRIEVNKLIENTTLTYIRGCCTLFGIKFLDNYLKGK